LSDVPAQGRRRGSIGNGFGMQGSHAAQKRNRAAAAAPGSVKAELTALKQERILEAATRLFLRNGFHGSTMDQIAAAIGVTKPFIYYQFRDKGEILAAISGYGAELSLSAIDDAEREAGPVTARMRWFCRRLTEIVIDHGHYLAVYHRETSNLDDADRKRITRRRIEIDARVSRLVARGVAAGEFSVADPAIAASAITMMISYCFQWYDKGRDRDAFVDIMADIAMRTLLPADARAGQGGDERTTGRR
jgi:AcrR family transcriptional regulator